MNRQLIAFFGWIVFLGLVMAYGCTRATEYSGSSEKNIFGPDGRQNVTSMEYPWSTVGYLEGGCTGTLIGRKLVLTAAHCIYDSAGKRIKPSLTYFSPGYGRTHQDSRQWIDYVWYGSREPESNRGKDWAVLRLRNPAGDTYKWLPVAKAEIDAALPFTTNLVGYSGDRNGGVTPSVHQGCYIIKRVGDRLLHECDSAAGISGGPMINIIQDRPTITAISVSEYRDGAATSVNRPSYDEDHANVAIDAAGFVSVVDYLLKTADAGVNPQAQEGIFEDPNPNAPGTVPGYNNPLPDPGGVPSATPIPSTIPGINGQPALTTVSRTDISTAVTHLLDDLATFKSLSAQLIGDTRLLALSDQMLVNVQSIHEKLTPQVGENLLTPQSFLSVQELNSIRPLVGTFFERMTRTQDQLIYDFRVVAYSSALDDQMERLVNTSNPLHAAN